MSVSPSLSIPSSQSSGVAVGVAVGGGVGIGVGGGVGNGVAVGGGGVELGATVGPVVGGGGGGARYVGAGMMNVGAAPTSVGAWLGAAEGDSRSEGLADGFWLGVGVAMAEGTPARTPSPDVGSGPAELVGRARSSQP